MSVATAQKGSAGRWGPLWNARPADWAGIEEQQVPTYEAALGRIDLAPGERVLEVGCGSGVFLRLAADRGAQVTGIDASDELVQIARRRVPEADVRVADLESLPFEESSFDAVFGFNAFFFALDMVGALREARRVAKPGAPVVIQVWGAPERCDLTAMKQGVAAALAAAVPHGGAEGPPQPLLSAPGVLESLAEPAGLRPESAFALSWAYEYAGEDDLARAMASPGPMREAASILSEAGLRDAIVASLEPYRTPSGGYRLENEWHYLIARAWPV
jgi:SAM-dependent methyltransferase